MWAAVDCSTDSSVVVTTRNSEPAQGGAAQVALRSWFAPASMTALEIVLGIDNIIFISILVGRLPERRRNRARIQGLALAMLTRILLLLSLAWMMRLTEPLSP